MMGFYIALVSRGHRCRLGPSVRNVYLSAADGLRKVVKDGMLVLILPGLTSVSPPVS